ncbi:MAG: hypothetical protein HZC24_09455 [Rhodocyclales bacterium]|nr:hypothetical protein [Rhodocyclales bacterium]
METAILTSIVAGSSALLGVALTSAIQSRTQRNNQQFQLALESSKRESDLREKERVLALERLAVAHRKLNIIGREFSLTSLDINWRAEMKDSEYDQRYLSVCENVDELRVIAGLYETSLIEDVEKMYGQMNIFWGNFKNVLRLTNLGEKVDHTTSCFQQAHATAIDIGRQAQALKSKLSELARRYRTDG